MFSICITYGHYALRAVSFYSSRVLIALIICRKFVLGEKYPPYMHVGPVMLLLVLPIT